MIVKTPFSTPYRVSTITCNGSINNLDSVDLCGLYENISTIDIGSNKIGFVYISDKDGNNFKGINPKKPKKKDTSGLKKKKFDNAISGYFQTRKDYFPSIKIFRNGTIQMTGLKTIEDGKKLNKQVFKILNDIIINNPKKITDLDISKTKLSSGEFRVRLINSDFSIPYNIRRKDLHHLLISDEYKNTSSFQPGTYPGVKLQYFWNPVNENINGRCNCNMKCFGKGDGSGDGKCKKITVSIFESGKILITGAINFVQIDEAYNYISNVLKKHQNSLEKRYLI